MQVKHFLIFLTACALLAVGTVQAQAPFIDPADDANHMGVAEDILFWTPEQQVAGFRNIEKLYPTRTILAGGTPYPLPENRVELDAVSIHHEEQTMSLDEYFHRQSVAGLLVIKDGHLVYERYGLGNTRDSRWISFSVTKSVVSMLVGAAIRDGYIRSVDEKVTDYLPRLKGSSYEASSIRDILQMASGVQWNEDYADPESDINLADWQTLALYDYLGRKSREAEPGTVFNYNTAESNLVGSLLRSAIGNNLSTYLTEKIWRPFGMESDAFWSLTEPGGGEFGGCCISATLRDYGRIGLFALAGGKLADGTQVLPEGWIRDSTNPSRGNGSYGYLWWLGENGVYEASGIFGQGILIHPEEQVVIAVHSARPDASKPLDWNLQSAMYGAVVRALQQPERTAARQAKP